jgi:hypothetical protein
MQITIELPEDIAVGLQSKEYGATDRLCKQEGH